MVRHNLFFWVRPYFFIFFLILGCLFLVNCSKQSRSSSQTQLLSDGVTKSSETQSSVDYFKNIFEEFYLWNNHIAIQGLDEKDFDSPESLLQYVRSEIEDDRFSYVQLLTDWQSYSQGSSTLFGIGFSIVADKLYVIHVFENCNAFAAGLKRSYQITKINGQSMPARGLINEITQSESISLTYINDQGIAVDTSMQKSECNFNTVLHSQVFSTGNMKIGYIVYNSFVDALFDQEILPAFQLFESENIDKLIIDLRYNGGGGVNSADKLLDVIAGNRLASNIKWKLNHNSNKSRYNSATYFKEASIQLNHLDRVFFLNTANTASAAELIQLGLMDYQSDITSTRVGGYTNGKPFGMYGFEKDNYMLWPICFRMSSGNGITDYVDGLAPDISVTAAAIYPWGSLKDSLLQSVFIELGIISTSPLISTKLSLEKPREILMKKDQTLNPLSRIY